MAVYKRTQEITDQGKLNDQISLSEQHLYGSSRLGLRSVDNTLNNSIFENLGLNLFGEYQTGEHELGGPIRFNLNSSHRPLGAKTYELSNHLGNVLATVSDRKLWANNGNSRIADVKSASDYYPFGMAIADRTMQSERYRYGFNGMEKDDEMKGLGNSYTTEFRQYDSRVGRWLSLDPLSAKYPEQSGYVGFNNNPIYYKDPKGLEGEPPLSEAQLVRANAIATAGIEKYGNNAGRHTNGGKVLREFLNMDGYKKQEQRAKQLEKYFEDEVGAIYEEGTEQYARMYNAAVGFYEEGAYLSAVNPELYSVYSGIIENAESVGAKFDAIAARSHEVYQRNQSFSMMGMIVMAYAAAYGGGQNFPYQSTKLYSTVAVSSSAETVTMYRSVSAAEAKSISSGYLSFGEGAMEAKQFWLTKSALDKWNSTRLGGQYWVEVQVPKSLVGKGKPLNTATQVDIHIGPNATIGNRAALEQVNSEIISVKVYTNPAYYNRMIKEMVKAAKSK